MRHRQSKEKVEATAAALWLKVVKTARTSFRTFMTDQAARPLTDAAYKKARQKWIDAEVKVKAIIEKGSCCEKKK
jgi:hypothetical protein